MVSFCVGGVLCGIRLVIWLKLVLLYSWKFIVLLVEVVIVWNVELLLLLLFVLMFM